MKKLLPLIFILFFTLNFWCQVTNEGEPISWSIIKEKNSLTPIVLPQIDIQKIRKEDEVADKIKTKPFRIGVLHDVNFGLNDSGYWTKLSNGDRIWRIFLSSKDALNMSIVFDKFYLPEGARIYLYNNDKTDLLGAYTNKNNNKDNVLSTWLVEGDKLWLEYFEPQQVKDQGKLRISHIMHGYRLGHKYQKGYFSEKADEFFDRSGNCNHDVDCPIGADFENERDLLKKSVAFMFMPIPNSSFVGICTGTLINNTAQDKTPYFLTADHCSGSPTNLYTMRFNWISPNPVCASTASSTNSSTNFTINGATLVANNSNSDFMLLELNQAIPDDWDVTFAGWDKTDVAPPFVVGIHHPQGDIMKISRDNSGVTKTAATIDGTTAQSWLISSSGGGWEIGVTEGGSSGSALFDDDGRIIGQLFGGSAACDEDENTGETLTTENGGSDVYGRFGVSWNAGSTATTRLNDWLDPGNINPNTLDALQNVLATNDEVIEQNLTLYPNPTNGLIQVKIDDISGDLKYDIYNLLGQNLRSSLLQIGESIDLSSLPNSIYLVKITDLDRSASITKKIVLNK